MDMYVIHVTIRFAFRLEILIHVYFTKIPPLCTLSLDALLVKRSIIILCGVNGWKLSIKITLDKYQNRIFLEKRRRSISYEIFRLVTLVTWCIMSKNGRDWCVYTHMRKSLQQINKSTLTVDKCSKFT